MNTTSLLDSSIFSFPVQSTKYFPGQLDSIFEKYISLLKIVDDEFSPLIAEHLDNIQNICNQIRSITKNYFQGKVSLSYDEFSELIKSLEKRLVPQDKNLVRTDQDTHLFKARPFFDKEFKLGDMFHVPFEKRYTIKTNRFSISGLPCLYLSNSIYTCWEELDRPLFSQMAVSRFQTKGKNFRYIDLSIDFHFLKSVITFTETLKENQDNVSSLKNIHKKVFEDFLYLFPLYVACYTKTSSNATDFKPEYIFPQMLMQWVVRSDYIDGVIYQSTKSLKIDASIKFNRPGFVNFAIPVRSSQENGFCSTLSKQFVFSQPITWEIINILDPAYVSKEMDFKTDILGKIMPAPPIMAINLGLEKLSMYHQTAFGKFEQYLFQTNLKEFP